jgi:hypothetical protein
MIQNLIIALKITPVLLGIILATIGTFLLVYIMIVIFKIDTIGKKNL